MPCWKIEADKDKETPEWNTKAHLEQILGERFDRGKQVVWLNQRIIEPNLNWSQWSHVLFGSEYLSSPFNPFTLIVLISNKAWLYELEFRTSWNFAVSLSRAAVYWGLQAQVSVREPHITSGDCYCYYFCWLLWLEMNPRLLWCRVRVYLTQIRWRHGVWTPK